MKEKVGARERDRVKVRGEVTGSGTVRAVMK